MATAYNQSRLHVERIQQSNCCTVNGTLFGGVIRHKPYIEATNTATNTTGRHRSIRQVFLHHTHPLPLYFTLNMGKGGTKFEGSAIGQRDRRGGAITGKELRREMRQYLATGFHPEVHAAATADILQPLPAPDPTRPHVFMELKYGSKVLGRLIIELFTDVVPLPASEFRKRCSRGARGGFQGTRVHKILRNLGCFGGRSDAYVLWTFPINMGCMMCMTTLCVPPSSCVYHTVCTIIVMCTLCTS